MTVVTGWFRATPDSSVLAGPRVLARRLIHVTDLDDEIERLQRLTGTVADLRMPIPDFGGLELAAVGGLLLIASERPFTDVQRRTAYSMIVPSLSTALGSQCAQGAQVLEPPEDIVPGSRARVRYPDGALAELVEHRPRDGEHPARIGDGGSVPTVRLRACRTVTRDALGAAIVFYRTVLGARDVRGWTFGPRTGRPGADVGVVQIGDLVLVTARDGVAVPDGPRAVVLGDPATWDALADGDRRGDTRLLHDVDVDGRAHLVRVEGQPVECWDLARARGPWTEG